MYVPSEVQATVDLPGAVEFACIMIPALLIGIFALLGLIIAQLGRIATALEKKHEATKGAPRPVDDKLH